MDPQLMVWGKEIFKTKTGKKGQCSYPDSEIYGPILASAIDYWSDAILGLLCLFTSN